MGAEGCEVVVAAYDRAIADGVPQDPELVAAPRARVEDALGGLGAEQERDGLGALFLDDPAFVEAFEAPHIARRPLEEV